LIEFEFKFVDARRLTRAEPVLRDYRYTLKEGAQRVDDRRFDEGC